MLNPTTEELKRLIASVLKKYRWTHTKLAQELDTTPETVSRWKREGGIHPDSLKSLEALDQNDKPLAVQPIPESSLTLPFTVTILRNSIHVSTDGNGNINISGMMFAKLKTEGLKNG